MLGIVDDTEEKSQKDQVVTTSKPSKLDVHMNIHNNVPFASLNVDMIPHINVHIIFHISFPQNVHMIDHINVHKKRSII